MLSTDCSSVRTSTDTNRSSAGRGFFRNKARLLTRSVECSDVSDFENTKSNFNVTSMNTTSMNMTSMNMSSMNTTLAGLTSMNTTMDMSSSVDVASMNNTGLISFKDCIKDRSQQTIDLNIDDIDEMMKTLRVDLHEAQEKTRLQKQRFFELRFKRRLRSQGITLNDGQTNKIILPPLQTKH